MKRPFTIVLACALLGSLGVNGYLVLHAKNVHDGIVASPQRAMVCFDALGRVTYGDDWKLCQTVRVETPVELNLEAPSALG